MMAAHWDALALSLGAGLVLGVVYYLSLWWTVQRLPRVRRPALWAVASLFVRLAIVLAGLYVIGDGHWQRLLAGLAGVIIMRTVFVRRLDPQRRREQTEDQAA